jgi:hypothetical protein
MNCSLRATWRRRRGKGEGLNQSNNDRLASSTGQAKGRRCKTNEKLDKRVVERLIIKKTCTLNELEQMINELPGEQLYKREERQWSQAGGHEQKGLQQFQQGLNEAYLDPRWPASVPYRPRTTARQTGDVSETPWECPEWPRAVSARVSEEGSD